MDTNSALDQEVLDIAYIEIESAFGDTTASLYKEYFKHKKTDEVLSTLRDVLSDNLGPKKTEEKMQHIENVLKQYKPNDI